MLNEVGLKINGEDGSGKAFKSAQANMRNMASAAAVMEGPLGQVAGRINAVGAAIGRMNPLLLGGSTAFAAWLTFQKAAISEAGELEVQLFRINKQLEITGHSSGVTGNQINRLAREIGVATLASQQGARDAVSALLAYDSIINDEFTKTLKLSQDITAVFGGDMRTNTLKLARALENPREGLQLLNRNILISTKEWRENVSAMFEAGEEAKAQQEILSALEKKLGGAGVSEAGGVKGSVDSLSEAWTDLKTNLAQTKPFKDAVDAVTELFRAANRQVDGSAENQLDLAVQKQQDLTKKIAEIRADNNNNLGGFFFARRGELEELESELRLTNQTITILSKYLNIKAEQELATRRNAEAKRQERIAQKKLDQEFENAIAVSERHDKELKKEFSDRAKELKKLEAAYESLWNRALPPLEKLNEAYRQDAINAVEALKARGASEKEIRDTLLLLESNYQDAKAQLNQNKDLQSLEQSLLTQEQRIEESYESRLFTIEDYFQREVISYQRKEELITLLTAQEAKRREDIEKQSAQTITNYKRSVVASAAGLLQQLGAKSKEAAYLAIAINKSLAIGQAIQNTAVAVTAALKYPPGVREAEIAYIRGLGAAQIGIITASGLVEAANYSGGGGGGGGGYSQSPGSIPDVPAPIEAPQQQRELHIYLYGNVVAEDLPGLISRGLQDAHEYDLIELTTSDNQRINVNSANSAGG